MQTLLQQASHEQDVLAALTAFGRPEITGPAPSPLVSPQGGVEVQSAVPHVWQVSLQGSAIASQAPLPATSAVDQNNIAEQVHLP